MTAQSAGRRFQPRKAMPVACGVALGAMIVRIPGGIALLLPAMLGLLVLIGLVHALVTWPEAPSGRTRFLRWTVFAFMSRLAFGLFVTNAGGLVGAYVLAPDSVTYHNIALDLVQHWTHGLPFPYIPDGKEGFYYLLGALYWVFGGQTTAGLVVNAALAAALVPIVSDTTHRLFGEKAAARVPPLVVLMPGLFLWASQLLKEAAILFLVAVAVNCAVRVMERATLRPLVGLTLSLALLFTFRGWVALVVAGGLVAAIAFGRREVVSGVGTAVGVLAFIVVILSFGVGYSGYRAAVNSDLAQANKVRRDLALTASTGFDHETDISTSQRALLYLPRGLFNFTVGPFPWQIRSLQQLPVLPDMLVWWFLLPSLWRGQREGRRRIGRSILVVILPAVSTSCLLALAVGNFGTAVRERSQVIIVLVPVIALGLSQRKALSPPEGTSLKRGEALIRVA